MAMENTLAYYAMATITAVERFIEQPHMCVVLQLRFKVFFSFFTKNAKSIIGSAETILCIALFMPPEAGIVLEIVLR